MRISPEIPRQAFLFLMAVGTGAGMLLVYDMLRIFRRIVKHRTPGIAVEDMIFWIACAFWLFRLMYQENDGSIRGFIILGAFLGMLLYNLGCSSLIVKGGTAILRIPAKVIGRWAQKNRKRMKKRLKKVWKAVKMGLCKL